MTATSRLQHLQRPLHVCSDYSSGRFTSAAIPYHWTSTRRLQHWTSNGAQMSPTVARLVKQAQAAATPAAAA
ncbi:MAG: hypothetical protein MK041_10385 [Aquabacterium sp.]|nr:hypothetical protein [Aquabacterium sp.]